MQLHAILAAAQKAARTKAHTAVTNDQYLRGTCKVTCTSHYQSIKCASYSARPEAKSNTTMAEFRVPEFIEWELTPEQRREAYGFRALFGEHLVPAPLQKELKDFEAWSSNIVQLDR